MRTPTRALAAVWVAVLGGAAAGGLLFPSATFSDADSFAHAATVMLSGDWQHTYADPWLQAGPFEMLVCLAGRTLGGSLRGEPAALNALGALALLTVATAVFGRRWREVALVGAAALGLGIVSDMWEWGHPSELFIGLVWLLAARSARRGNVVIAGALVGISAGFETWGLLGGAVLFLLPTLRRTVAAGLLALGTAIAIYAPFATGGEFHMFQQHWAITGGVPGALFGDGTPFTWSMRLAEAVVVVAVGSAVALRTRRYAWCVWLVPALTSLCRLGLDPVRYGYYWDTALTLLLFGLTPWLLAPRATAHTLREALRRPRVPALVD